MEMHIVKQSRKLIKPSTPTPATLRQFKISVIDEVAPTMNVSVLLFFSVNTENNPKFVARLEKSLEKALKPFYPLAGRYVEEIRTVDCNDQGAEFIHATINIKLQDFLDSEVNNVDVKCLLEFFPSVIGAADQITDPMLAIQVTTFECGGVALGVSISHRIADASTLSTFLTQWAAISREENDLEFTRLGFNASAMFPAARGLPRLELGLPRSLTDDVLSKNVTKKLSFSDSAISNFKKKALLNGRNGAPKWSKVQSVSALLVKALMDVDRSKHKYPRDFVVVQAINLRERTASLIPKHSCGNLFGVLTTECGIVETTEELVDVIRDSVKNTINNYLKVRHDSEEGRTMVLNSIPRALNNPPTKNVVLLTSWCKFPFYEADFGFGKPIWVSCGNVPVKNTAYLMDGVGGNGVEAYVCVEANDVPYFEQALALVMKAFAD